MAREIVRIILTIPVVQIIHLPVLPQEHLIEAAVTIRVVPIIPAVHRQAKAAPAAQVHR